MLVYSNALVLLVATTYSSTLVVQYTLPIQCSFTRAATANNSVAMLSDQTLDQVVISVTLQLLVTLYYDLGFTQAVPSGATVTYGQQLYAKVSIASSSALSDSSVHLQARAHTYCKATHTAARSVL